MGMINNKTIRLSTVATLKSNANITATIYDSKVTPHMFDRLPVVGVYLTNSSADGRNHRTPGFVRTVDLNIEIAVSGNANNYANTMDDLMFAVKNTLLGNTSWYGIFENVSGYQEQMTLEDGGEQPIALGRLTFNTEIVEVN